MYLAALSAAATPRHATRCIAAAAERHPVLREVPTAEAILDLLGPSGEKDYDKRDSVLLAVIAEHQQAKGPAAEAWTFILVRSFLTVLQRMAKKLRSIKAPDERDSIVAEGLFVAVGNLDCSTGRSHVSQVLLSKTWQHVLHLNQRAMAYAARAEPMDDEGLEKELWDRGVVDRGPRYFQDQLAMSATELRALLFRWMGKSFAAEDLDLVADTILSGKDVTDLVRERHSDASPADRKRIEGRLRYSRDQVMRRLRESLGDRLKREAVLTGNYPVSA